MITNLLRRDVLQKILHAFAIPVIIPLASCSRGENNAASDTSTATATSDNHVCASVQAMDGAARSLRQSLHYIETSSDPNMVCAGCAFFHVGDSATCGICDIYSGGPANAGGHCDSWSKRQA